MLFNSLDYILFLGIAVAGFWLLARHSQLRIGFVFVASGPLVRSSYRAAEAFLTEEMDRYGKRRKLSVLT